MREITVIADNYNDKKLNSPNDVVVSKLGNVCLLTFLRDFNKSGRAQIYK